VAAKETEAVTEEGNLARQVDAAQSILNTPAADEARRLELSLAECCRAVAEAMARTDPGSGASVLATNAGLAMFAGAGSPLTQGLAMGLDGDVTAADLDAMEAHLCPAGEGSRQFELTPFAHPTLSVLLAERGYRVHEWQLVWSRPVPSEAQAPAPPELEIRRVKPGEEDLFFRAVMAGFMETEDVPEHAIGLMRPTAFADRHELFLAWLGDEPIGGASLSYFDGVAFVNGSGVRPTFRRRGAQGALIRVRLDRARELGCDLACSSTLPGTASRRNMERHGFHVAYPKLVMLKMASAERPAHGHDSAL
jgi:GNAT superfamily N-acetyltransferase